MTSEIILSKELRLDGIRLERSLWSTALLKTVEQSVATECGQGKRGNRTLLRPLLPLGDYAHPQSSAPLWCNIKGFAL